MADEESLGRYYVGVGVDHSELKSGMQQAVNNVKAGSQEMMSYLASFKNVAAGALKGFAVAAVTAIGAYIVQSTKMAKQTIESENLFTVSMGKMRGAARQWSEDLRDSLGLNAYEIRKSAGVWYVIYENMGFAQESALEMSENLTMLAEDMTSFYNIAGGSAQATQELRSMMAGETEVARRYGINISEAAIKTFAYSNGIAAAGTELNELQKVTARYNIILESTQKAQGDLARTIDSPMNQIWIMQSEMKQASADIGYAFLPIANQMLAGLRPLTKGFADFAQSLKNQQTDIRQVGQDFLDFYKTTGKTAAGEKELQQRMNDLGRVFPQVVTQYDSLGNVRKIDIKLLQQIIDKENELEKMRFDNANKEKQRRADAQIQRAKELVDANQRKLATLQIEGPEGYLQSLGKNIGYLGQGLGGKEDPIKAAQRLYSESVLQMKTALEEANASLRKAIAERDNLIYKPMTYKSTNIDLPGGNGSGSGASKKSEYDQAKALYERDIAAYGVTIQRKIELYHQYLDAVKKSEDERVEYEKLGNDLLAEATHKTYADAKAAYEKDVAANSLSIQQKINLYELYMSKVQKDDEETYEYEKTLSELKKELILQEAQLAKMSAAQRMDHEKNMINQEIELIHWRASVNQISREQEIQAVMDAERRKYELERDALLQKAQLEQNDPIQHAQVIAQLEQLDDEYQARYLQQLRELAQESVSVWTGMIDSIKSLSDQLWEGLKNGTLTWQGALKAVVEKVTKYFFDMGVDVVANWLKNLLIKKATTEAANTAEMALEKAKYTAAAAAGGAAATAMVNANSAAFQATLGMITAMANAIAVIPPDGPVMAAQMMAGVATAQGTMAASTAAANAGISAAMTMPALEVGAWNIPGIMPALLHPGEMVIPEQFAEGARKTGVIGGDGGEAGGAGGDIHIHAMDTKSFLNFARGNKKVFGMIARELARDGGY